MCAQKIKTLEEFKHSSQGQRSRSNMPSFILFIEASKEREHVNLYQIQNGFKVIDNFLVEKKYKKIVLKLKGQGQRSMRSNYPSKVHDDIYSIN